MYTPPEISKKMKVEVNLVYRRIRQLELEPLKKLGALRYYDIKDFTEIKTRKHVNIEFCRSKIIIVQYWSMMKSLKYDQEIADELGIKLNKLQRILLELKKNDNCITVQSKLC
jgi:hypothetical protein